MKEVKLPSGATLKIGISNFAVAKTLYHSVLKELRTIDIGAGVSVSSLYKDLFCAGFSSPEIENNLWACFSRCTYNDLKIDQDTFEPVAARDDYMTVCMEVAKENISPFGKSLYAEYKRLLAMIEESQS